MYYWIEISYLLYNLKVLYFYYKPVLESFKYKKNLANKLKFFFYIY